MPRRARIVACGYPMHVILCGIDRAAIFFDDRKNAGSHNAHSSISEVHGTSGPRPGPAQSVGQWLPISPANSM